VVEPRQILVGPRSELKLSKLCQILPKSTKFGQDWAESAKIWLDLDGSQRD